MEESPVGRYVFEDCTFDVHSGELLRKGHRLRLPEQNARLLTMLLKRPGIPLERSEIRSGIWPAGEHLNHDHAISNGINQLRALLRDDSRNPSFIETLPKRGYRFIADVRFEPAETEVYAVQDSPSAKSAEPPVETSSVPRPAPRSHGKMAMLLASGLVVALCMLAFVVTHRRQAAAPPAAKHDLILAIVPIHAEGDVAKRLAEPFRLELTDAASQLPGVQVRAANSIGAAPADPAQFRDLAQKLQVDILLVGRMVGTGNSLDLSFELVRGSDAAHLASFHYTGTIDTLGSIRIRMERDLFQTLSDTKHNHLEPLHSTENPQAYRDYLAARASLMEHSDESIRTAIAGFRRAIQEDGSFAQAYSGLGNASMLMAEHLATGKEENYAIAREASERAINLNPRIAEAHSTMGFLLFRHDWDAAAAEPELKRAIELEPGQAMPRITYALLLGNTGRITEALAQVDRAHAADPLWPPVYLTEAYLAAADRDNNRALSAARTLLQLRPDWPLAYDQEAWALWYAGEREHAVREWLEMAELEHDDARIRLEKDGYAVLVSSGVRAYSLLKLHAAEQKITWAHPNDFELAEWQLNAGNEQDALRSLATMIQVRDPESLQIAVSPAYFSLHKNPEFLKLVAGVSPLKP